MLKLLKKSAIKLSQQAKKIPVALKSDGDFLAAIASATVATFIMAMAIF
jgi:hypothetical protein